MDIFIPESVHITHHKGKHTEKLNWLRAGVLGANDGIVSIAGLVMGVAGATTSPTIIFAAGTAGIIAGAISMAVGEYISVSSSKDTEKALLEKEEYRLEHHPDKELEDLENIYIEKGLSAATARKVAEELTAQDASAAHFDALGIDPKHLTNPWDAALASAFAFFVGALIPLIVVFLPPQSLRVPVTFFSVVVALVITGVVSAKVGKANMMRAVLRVVVGGVLAMVVTYSIGRLLHVKGM